MNIHYMYNHDIRMVYLSKNSTMAIRYTIRGINYGVTGCVTDVIDIFEGSLLYDGVKRRW